MLVYTLESFQRNKLVDEIVVAAEPEYFSLIKRLVTKYKLTKVSGIVAGGKERQDSVYSALQSLRAEDKDLILVHDAARPLLSQSVLTAALQKAAKKGNAVVCIKARDTLVIKKTSGLIYPDRDNIYYIQTPQIFRYKILMEAMHNAYDNNLTGTDESIIVSAAGKKVNFIEGSVLNFKVTTSEDMLILTKILTKKQVSAGNLVPK